MVKVVHTVGYCIFGEQFHFTNILEKAIDKRAKIFLKSMFTPCMAYSWGSSLAERVTI